MRPFSIAILAFLCLSLTGCDYKWDNAPSKKHATSDARLLGDFYQQDEKGHRVNIAITKSGDRDYPFAVTLEEASEEIVLEELLLLQTFKIGKHHFMFATPKELKGETHIVYRYTVSKTQVAFEVLDLDFFEKNENVLPGTKKIPRIKTVFVFEELAQDWFEKNEIVTDVHFTASSEQIDAFLQLHGGTRELFDNEHPILLNRKGT